MPKRGSVGARAQRARRRQATGSQRGSRSGRAKSKFTTARKRQMRTPSPTVTTKRVFKNPYGVVGRAKERSK